MPCYRPVSGFQNNPGDRLVFSRVQATGSRVRVLDVPCNTCVGCRLERARQWAMRCMDEASLYKANSFITLTFDPDKVGDRGLPHCCLRCKREFVGLSLHVCEFQLFMKRLRKSFGKLRFFHCGEYGSKTGRPHYHALLFGLGFVDRVLFKVTDCGEMIYRSASLEKIWPFGFSSVGDVSFGSAAYVARYHLKKVGNVVSDDHYISKSGELLYPEYVTMSRRPGIGRGWFDKFESDVYPLDRRIIKGVDTKPCRFYDLLYEGSDPEGFKRVKLARSLAVDRKDNTEARLRVKEEVKLSQISTLKEAL